MKNFQTKDLSREGIRLIISEKVAMGMLSLLLSALSFYGGYTYGTQKLSSGPVLVEEAYSLPTSTQK
ncbi:MAG: hypothetical protein AB4372_11900 [Xenococcus sp. (in: cyanobacteria)]